MNDENDENENGNGEPTWFSQLSDVVNEGIDEMLMKIGDENTRTLLRDVANRIEKYYQCFDRPKNLEKETEKYNEYINGVQQAIGVKLHTLRVTSLTFYDNNEIDRVRKTLEAINKILDERRRKIMEDQINGNENYKNRLTLKLVNNPEKSEEIPPVYSDGEGRRYQFFTKTGDLELIYQEGENNE